MSAGDNQDPNSLIRRTYAKDVLALLDNHLQHDLYPRDRENLENATKKVTLHVAVGSAIGFGLGIFLARRAAIRQKVVFDLFKAREANQPKIRHLKAILEDGSEMVIPSNNIERGLPPNFDKVRNVGKILRYIFFPTAGLWLGGKLGSYTGTKAARNSLAGEPDSDQRIHTAFRRLRADVLRKNAEVMLKEAEALEKALDGGERDVWGDDESGVF